MIPIDGWSELIYRTDGISQGIAPRSALSILAGDISEMVTAYRYDGISFFQAGDRVNSLAGCWYALGWLDTGCCLGLLKTPHFNRTWPDVTGTFDKDNQVRLDEKTGRYENMLGRAIQSVNSAPEQNTDAYVIADRLLVVARLFHSWGTYSINRKESGFPLACFSYGYGWLDCGVRTGFFRICGSRDLFTI
jgi:hypothetical protein